MNWVLKEDNLNLKLSLLAGFARGMELTKRNVLRLSAKFFDPMGLIIPVAVSLRILF